MSFLACFEMLSPTGSLKVSYWHGVLIAKGSAEGTYQEETFQGGGGMQLVQPGDQLLFFSTERGSKCSGYSVVWVWASPEDAPDFPTTLA